MNLRQCGVVVGLMLTVGAVGAAPAQAHHDHVLQTPNGQCHQVARGQTAIADSEHGGHHRFHANVHFGATESSTNGDALGDGRSRVTVRGGTCPAQ